MNSPGVNSRDLKISVDRAVFDWPFSAERMIYHENVFLLSLGLFDLCAGVKLFKDTEQKHWQLEYGTVGLQKWKRLV